MDVSEVAEKIKLLTSEDGAAELSGEAHLVRSVRLESHELASTAVREGWGIRSDGDSEFQFRAPLCLSPPRVRKSRGNSASGFGRSKSWRNRRWRTAIVSSLSCPQKLPTSRPRRNEGS